MIARSATADLFALPATEDQDVFGLLVDPVAAGIAHLEGCPPLLGGRVEWAELVVGLRAFEGRWGAVARPLCASESRRQSEAPMSL
jgi:hypothetical protein